MFLSGFTKDVVKVFRFQINLLWKKLRSCMTTWSKKASQVKILRQALASSEHTWTVRVCHCDKKQICILVYFLLHVRRFVMKYQYNAVDIISIEENPVWTGMVSIAVLEDSCKEIVSVKTTKHKKGHVQSTLQQKQMAQNYHLWLSSRGKAIIQKNKKLFYSFILKCVDEYWVNPY